MTREEIRQRLVALASTPRPETRSVAADCYAMMVSPPPRGAEFICPRCGERTFYKDVNSLGFVSECVQAMRSLNALGLKVAFDLAAYCRKCSAGSLSSDVRLYIAYAENDIHDAGVVSSLDLGILQRFLQGDFKWEDSHGDEHALLDHLDRLLHMLGFAMRTGPW